MWRDDATGRDVSATVDARSASILSIAIQLRMLVHSALDRDDMPAVRSLNRAADAACLFLSPAQCGQYLAWVRTVGPRDEPLMIKGWDA